MDDGLRQQMGAILEAGILGDQEGLDALVGGKKRSCFRLSEIRTEERGGGNTRGERCYYDTADALVEAAEEGRAIDGV